jgi:hypothetical protein
MGAIYMKDNIMEVNYTGMPGIEIGYGVIKQRKDGTKYFLVKCCPFCGEKHTHGADSFSDLSLRAAHCMKPNAGYLLRQIGDEPISSDAYFHRCFGIVLKPTEITKNIVNGKYD